MCREDVICSARQQSIESGDKNANVYPTPAPLSKPANIIQLGSRSLPNYTTHSAGHHARLSLEGGVCGDIKVSDISVTYYCGPT